MNAKQRQWTERILWAVVPVGVPIRVLKETPVFEQPSIRSRASADVDPGTILLLKAVSERGYWVQVEDEEGHRGWIPARRTDYSTSTEADAPVVPAATEESPDLKTPAQHDELLWSLGGLARSTFGSRFGRDSYSTKSIGIQASVGFPLTSSSESKGAAWSGFQLGFLKASEGFSVPIRYRLGLQEHESSWMSGVDLGLFWERARSQNRPSLSFGYSYGYAPRPQGFELIFRGGGELGLTRRWSLELTLGHSL